MEKTEIKYERLETFLRYLANNKENKAIAEASRIIGKEVWSLVVLYSVNTAIDAERIRRVGAAGGGDALINIALAATEHAASTIWDQSKPETREKLKDRSAVTRVLEAIAELYLQANA